MTKIMNGKVPKYLEDLFKPKQSGDSDNKLAKNSQSVTVELFTGTACPQTNAKRTQRNCTLDIF